MRMWAAVRPENLGLTTLTSAFVTPSIGLEACGVEGLERGRETGAKPIIKQTPYQQGHCDDIPK